MSLIMKSPDVAIIGGAPGEGDEISVDAIAFNGTSSYIQYTNNFFRDTDLRYTEVNNGFTLSLWVKPSTGLANNSVFRIIDVRSGSTNQIYSVLFKTNAAGARQIEILYEDDNSNFLQVTTGYGPSLLTLGSWNHILYSVKQQGGASGDGFHHMFVNDALLTNGSFGNDSDAGDITATPTTTTNSTIGKLETSGSGYYDGCLSEVWLGDGYYDLSVESNRRKFISSNDKPVQLPASPLVYLKGTASTWANTGSSDLGTQTLNSITDCADSPSD